MNNDLAVNAFENGGTIIDHIISMFGPAMDIVIVLFKHAQIVWETIWF